MSVINVLSSAIANRIAAGEVVERTYSIVKELVENSLDADAKNIIVEIRNGGMDYIRITDDGRGIDKEDMPTAFLAHATSKIKNIDDLNAIATLGFRGEALPSIASVAEVKMTSRVSGEDLGYYVKYENDKYIEGGSCGCPYGTTVEVFDVFKNVPARKKFFEQSRKEDSAVTELMQKLILANFTVNFQYIINGKEKILSNGGGIKDAIYTVYGEETLNNLRYIENEINGMTLKGYAGIPSFTKHNKKFQTLIVNGRYVEDEDVSYFSYLCYQDFLMTRQYPFYVLYINLPYDMLDVNVHPGKAKVKFVDTVSLKSLVMGSLKKMIGDEATFPNSLRFETDKNSTEIKEHENDIAATDIQKVSNIERFYDITSSKLSFRQRPIGSIFNVIENLNDNIPIIHQYSKNNFEVQPIKMDFKDSFEFRIVGEVFATYIIAECENDLYFIDQHAAHEKILFDKLMSQYDNKSVAMQDLLLPYIFSVSADEEAILTEKTVELAACGFGIEYFGDYTYRIMSIPACCSDINFNDFVANLFQVLGKSRLSGASIIKENIMQAACKAAVKGKDRLSESEMRYLIDELRSRNVTLFCPHGRPIMIKISKTELEKWFKRKI